jgi:hypothetical protein
MTRYDLVIAHTAVGSLEGVYNYFRRDGYGGAESHFMVGYDGTVWQFQDTQYQAEANGAANRRAISIETADIGIGFQRWDTADGGAVPAWTNAQLDALVKLIGWICTTHNIPRVAVTDSLPSRRGIAYHRLGVPGYAVPNGEIWSSSRGKTCPGPRRIAQLPGIIARLNKEEDIVATAAELRQIVKEEVAVQLAAIAKRSDVGFARDQVLTTLGVGNPQSAPTTGGQVGRDRLTDLWDRMGAICDRLDEMLVLMTALAKRASETPNQGQ